MIPVRWPVAAQFRAFRSISDLWRNCYLPLGPGFRAFDGFSRSASKACWGASEASFVANHVPEGGLQEELWRKFFSEPTEWWDNRRSKESLRHPDFRHKKSKEPLWLNSWYKPAWVDSELALLDSREDYLEVESCRKLCEDGQVNEAVDALNHLVQRGCRLDSNIFYCVLKRCIAQKDLDLGRRIHALSVESGFERNAFLATHLIGLYASHDRLEEAMQVFSKVSTPDAYMWASITLAHSRHGEAKQAIALYRQMHESTVEPDNRIFVAVLKACASVGDLAAGKDVHAHLLASASKGDVFAQTCLVDMYAKCGSLKDAQTVFNGLSQKDVVTWNAMITGYAQHGMGQDALNLYNGMLQEGITRPNSVTFVCLLQACASMGTAGVNEGKQLHEQIEERGLEGDIVVGSSIVNMYAKCGSLEDAQRLFDRLPKKNVVTWNAMIAGYAQQGMSQQALNLYKCMQHEATTPPDPLTFVCLLQACAGVGEAALPQGKQLHAQIEQLGAQADMVVGASLVNMYSKCGSLEDAQTVFDRLTQKDVVTWTSMIGGYAQQGMGQKALALYSRMQQHGIIQPDSATFVCLLQACASAEALPLGKQLHMEIEERGLGADVVVGAALVNMYAKCGNMADAQQVFDVLPARDIVAWGALIQGYARQGNSRIVFQLADKMKQDSIQPNSITVLSVLIVCSHVGLVDEGRKYFQAMTTDYDISPSIEHYTCMVDLLGRAGHLEEAVWMVKSMPFQPNAAVWLSLLGACQKWSSIEIGQQAFEFAVKQDEKDAAAYVLMSNIYAGAEMWEEAEEMQARRKEFGAWKRPGQSWWADMEGVTHSFCGWG